MQDTNPFKFHNPVQVVEVGPGEVIMPDFSKYPTEMARRIFEAHLPQWSALFIRKNAHYGELANDLGVKAQFVDINRKIGPLRQILWEGKEQSPEDEPIERIILDLIGHLFITYDLLVQEKQSEG